MAPALLAAVFPHVVEFEAGFFGEGGGGPDLAVGVRVGAAHCLAFVFEDLHVAVLLLWGLVGGAVGGGRVCCWFGDLGQRRAGV